jgi:hypothetical protein
VCLTSHNGSPLFAENRVFCLREGEVNPSGSGTISGTALAQGKAARTWASIEQSRMVPSRVYRAVAVVHPGSLSIAHRF